MSAELSAEQRQGLQDDGFVILPGILTDDESHALSQTLDELWATQYIGPEYNDEPGVQFVPNLLQYSSIFERFVAEPIVLAAVRFVLGPDIRLNRIHGRRCDPDHGNQPLHDLNRRRGKPFFKANVIWCIDDFTPVNGSTRVIPGSHLADELFLARCADPLLPHPDERRLLARRGSALVHNSHLIHGGSRNESAAPRRSIQVAYTTPDILPFYDWRELPADITKTLGPQTLALLS